MNNKFLLCVALLSLSLNAVFIPQTLIKPTIYGKTPQQKRLLNRAKHAKKRQYNKIAQEIAATKRRHHEAEVLWQQEAKLLQHTAARIRQESAAKDAPQEQSYQLSGFGFF